MPGERAPGAQEPNYEQEFEEDPNDGGQEGDAGPGEAGQGDDATGQDAETRVEPEEVDQDLADFFPEQRQPTRGENRQQRLANENADLRRQLADARRTPAQTQVQQPPPQFGGMETDADFNARVQLLPPDERMEQRYLRSEQLRDIRDRQREQYQMFTTDKIGFDAKVSSDTKYKRWADRVEAKHQEFARQGQFVPREAVFRYLLGDHLLSQAGQKELGKQAEQGKRRVKAATTKSANAGSDVGRGSGRMTEAQARAKRLDGINI